MTLVTFAVPFESAAFRRRPVARTVRILHTGVGEEEARVSLELALCAELPDRVIAAGFAGGLDPGIPVGAVVTEGNGGVGRPAVFTTATEVVTTAAAKRALRHQTGADVVDMETAAIREVCAAAGVPWCAVRAVSDAATEDIGLPPALLEGLSKNLAATLPTLGWTLLRSAEHRRAFTRLVRGCRTAQSTLADALELALRE